MTQPAPQGEPIFEGISRGMQQGLWINFICNVSGLGRFWVGYCGIFNYLSKDNFFMI
jgi:hypothetical protein